MCTWASLQPLSPTDVLPSPIVGVHWHRIVLDEAQEVEGNESSKIVQMCMKLSGDHKWCVSGTPLGTGQISDLKNILVFLGQVSDGGR